VQGAVTVTVIAESDEEVVDPARKSVDVDARAVVSPAPGLSRNGRLAVVFACELGRLPVAVGS
jgi:N-acetylmuramic acid 6-phosphate (MurNAc-6-P) etherase